MPNPKNYNNLIEKLHKLVTNLYDAAGICEEVVDLVQELKADEEARQAEQAEQELVKDTIQTIPLAEPKKERISKEDFEVLKQVRQEQGEEPPNPAEYHIYGDYIPLAERIQKPTRKSNLADEAGF